MRLWDDEVVGSSGCMILKYKVTILLTFQSRFSAVFFEFPGIESLWH